jgi:hypothetical protein
MATFSRIPARAFLGLISLLSAGWGLFFLFNADHSVQLDNIANRIMSGDGFQQSPLLDSVPLLSSAESRAICNPREIRGTAIIRLRLFEDAINASDTRLADQRLKSLRSSVDRGSRSWLRADRGFFVVHPILERYQCRQSG